MDLEFAKTTVQIIIPKTLTAVASVLISLRITKTIDLPGNITSLSQRISYARQINPPRCRQQHVCW